jgi:antitoxin component YwqK of YwqJK toxin-antitoxin module
MQSRLLLLLLLPLLVLTSSPVTAAPRPAPDWWIFLFGKNKYDKRGQYHGRWTVYHDDAHTQVMTKGRFRHGRQIKTWYYYTQDGTLYRKEVYQHKGEEIATTLYHPNGTIAVTGTAKRVEDPVKIHYFWQGYWHYFTEQGQPQKKSYYSNGVLVETIYPEKPEQDQAK